MTNLDTGIYGAKVQSWKRANPRDLLRRLMDENKRCSRERLLKLFRDEAIGDDDIINSIIEYWFANNYHSLTARPQIAPEAKAAAKRHREAKVSEIKDKIHTRIREEAQIMLLDLMMPNGKALRDCTGRDCHKLGDKMGSWLKKIASKVKPNDVIGAVLSEADVRKMYGR